MRSIARRGEHLRGRVEQVGFFLADFDADARAFVLREWRPMPPDAFEYQSAYHVTLRDEIRPEIIKWAWDADACLVEVHSHGNDGIAWFSPSDLLRLRRVGAARALAASRAAYAAIVTAGDSFDGLAWLDEAEQPVQVTALEVDGVTHAATARTLPRLAELKDRHG